MAMAKAKSIALPVTDKCRNILGACWEAHLNTIKADAHGSKGEIYTSKVHYMVQKGTPYLIVPENHLHNINIVIDERGSLSVCSPIPGRLAGLLKSLNKLPPRLAMTGDVLRMKDSKVPVIADSLKKIILKEHEAASKASYGVSTILSSASATCRSRSEGLLSLLNEMLSSHVVISKYHASNWVLGYGVISFSFFYDLSTMAWHQGMNKFVGFVSAAASCQVEQDKLE